MENIKLKLTVLGCMVILLSTCSQEPMACNDVDVVNLASELAIDVFEENIDEIGYLACEEMGVNAYLSFIDIDCSEVVSDAISAILTPDSVFISNIKMTDQDDNMSYCEAKFIFNFKDIDFEKESEAFLENFFYDYGIDTDYAAIITSTISLFAGDDFWYELSQLREESMSINGVYEVESVNAFWFEVYLELDSLSL
tara:strand:+ start:4882 stop:5472 length:591 start_codon:yes stop_codon:yes gene_type:complete